MDNDSFMHNLLSFYPYWQYDVIKPFAQYNKSVNSTMSLETYYLLQIIRWFDGLTMTEVAQHVSTTKQQATLKVDKLVDAGYLERQSDAADRRIIKVVVTPDAVRALDAYHHNTKGFLDVLRQKLTEEDIEVFNSAIEQLLTVLPKLE